jgi:drug/metabolite transporter (DMT)-like permease
MATESSIQTQGIPATAFVVIAIGILAISLASIFIELAQAQNVPSLFIAAARMTIAGLLLTPLVLRKHWSHIRSLSRTALGLAALSGFFLAVHFATWISAYEYTTVLVATVLVTTSPLWAAILERVFLGARLTKLVMVGLLIGMIGSIVVAFARPPEGDIPLGREPLLGSVLALLGALAVAIYFVIGRKLRASLPLLPYIWIVYSFAALFLLLVVVLARIPITGYSAEGYFWIAAMALIPQLIGHTSFNYALKFVPASYIGIASQMEPVLSSILAVFVLAQIPNQIQIIGGVIILGGVLLASLAQSSRNQ